jgi:hypothetical protein
MDEQLVALAPNPNGAAPDFNTGHSLEVEVAITGVLSITISATFVLLRLTTVFKKSGRLYADDCTINHGAPDSLSGDVTLTCVSDC